MICVDIYMIVCFDCFHANAEDMFGDHLYVEFKTILNSMG